MGGDAGVQSPSRASSVSAIWTIARKDLLQRLRDRSAYLVGIIAPLGLVMVLNLTFGGAATSGGGLNLGLVDEDRGLVAAEFDSVARSLREDGVASVTPYADLAAATQAMSDGDVAAVFVLPAGLSDSVAAGGEAAFQVVADPERPVSARIAEGIARGFAVEVDTVSLAVATAIALDATTSGVAVPDDVIGLASSLPRSLAVVDDAVAGRGFDLTTYYAISISVFFLFFMVQFGVVGLIEERTGGTMARLLASPITPSSVLIGKLGAAAALGALSMALLVVATSFVLGAEWGAVVPVVALVLAGVLCALSVSALVSTMARTADQAANYSTFAALGLGTLGGSFFPLVFAPRTVDLLSRLTPHRWLLEGFRDSSYGGGLGDVVGPLLALGGFVAVVGGAALVRSHRLVPRR